MTCQSQLPWSFCHVVLVAVLLFQTRCLGQTSSQYQKFDPCTPYDYNPVNIGNDYVIGIAYWPGGLWEDWNVTKPGDTRNIPSLNPCLGSNVTYIDTSNNGSDVVKVDVDYNKRLAENGVVFGTFTVQTDVMADLNVINTLVSDHRKLIQDAAQSPSPVLSIVAFRGNITSPPMYVASFSDATTGQSGYVSKLGLIISLDKGILVPGGLDWFMFDGCSSCGSNETQCISFSQETSYRIYSQDSCGYPQITNTSVLTAFQGNTVSGQPLQSSYQLTSAYQYSISSAFSDILTNLDESLVQN